MRVEEAGYRLSIGRQCYINDLSKNTLRELAEEESFVIGPGQFVFLLTEETVCIPRDCIAFISVRATYKFRGLVNVSGFQVDPGYRGCLVFAMFNAGPMHIHLRRGEEIFTIWLSTLDKAVDSEFQGTDQIPDSLNAIPSKVVNGLAGEALTAYQVKELIEQQKQEITTTKNDLSKLKDDLGEKLSKVKDRFTYLATIAGLLLTGLLIVFGPVIKERIIASHQETQDSR